MTFWLANFFDRMWVLVVALGALILPLSKVIRRCTCGASVRACTAGTASCGRWSKGGGRAGSDAHAGV
jgi:hypothetical protein